MLPVDTAEMGRKVASNPGQPILKMSQSQVLVLAPFKARMSLFELPVLFRYGIFQRVGEWAERNLCLQDLCVNSIQHTRIGAPVFSGLQCPLKRCANPVGQVRSFAYGFGRFEMMAQPSIQKTCYLCFRLFAGAREFDRQT